MWELHGKDNTAFPSGGSPRAEQKKINNLKLVYKTVSSSSRRSTCLHDEIDYVVTT